MMNRRTHRALALFLVMIFLLYGCGFKKAEAQATSEPPKYTFEPTLSVSELFHMGNEAYKSMDYEKAGACYRTALERADTMEQPDSSTEETLFHVRNNLVLTLLQLEKNEEAWELSSELVTLEAPSRADHYGSILNHLVCANAVGRSAAETLDALINDGLYEMTELDELAEEDIGNFMKLSLSLVYNAIYIDMENGAADGILSVSASTAAPAVSAENYEMLIAMQEEEDRASFLLLMADILADLQMQNVETFGEEDPDITELLVYLSALTAAELEG